MNAPTIVMTKPIGPPHAPVVVLGPSLGTSTAVWHEASELLSTRMRVMAWDLPGHGASPASPMRFSITDLADAVAQATCDILNESEDNSVSCFFAGVSIGGAVSLELALRHTSLVRAVALVASGAQLGEQEFWQKRATAARRNSTSSLETISAQRWFAPGFAERKPTAADRLLRDLRKADDESYALCCEALAAYDVRDQLGLLIPPTLALWGEHDVVAPEFKAKEVASAVAHGEASMIAGVGHLPPFEAPADVSDALSRFFGQH